MKTKHLIITLFLLTSVACKAQKSQPAIKIVTTPNNELVRYSLYSSEKVYYYLGLEKLIDKRWQEIMIDISNKAPDMSALVNNLQSGKKIDGLFLSKQIPSIYKKAGAYRFKLNYGGSSAAIEKSIFSDEFHLK
ncbi:hypothetical protein ACVW0P_000595 [Mucilaginibacter sp. UYNi724]